MSYKYAFTEYPTSGVNKLLATGGAYGGGHIYNVTASTDLWNGAIIKRGDWLSFDNYAEDTATTFKGVVRGQAANKNWYVEVTEDGGLDALLVYNPPVVEAQFNKDASAEKHFYIAAGEVARAHELKVGDIFELSEDGFDLDTNSATLAAGKTINGVAGKKPTVVA